MSDSVQAVRRFNRFYTRQIGVLGEGHLNSPYSLTEVRVLYELTHRDQAIATDLARDLGLDEGYLSRILRKFQKHGIIARETSALDRRRNHIVLTRQGKQVFTPLDRNAGDAVAGILGPLSQSERARLVDAMETIERLLDDRKRAETGYSIRTHRAGDIGWIVERHGAVYSQEYGWGAVFEALVAEICARFLKNFDATRERCWIAERGNVRVGSIMLVKQSDEIAKLRLLLVEPEARGLGIGKRLVEECIAFARAAGYRKITLWTQSNLLAARRLYQSAGFQLTHEEENREFGSGLMAQVWDLQL